MHLSLAGDDVEGTSAEAENSQWTIVPSWDAREDSVFVVQVRSPLCASLAPGLVCVNSYYDLISQ